mgnify:CR=1 FL=1
MGLLSDQPRSADVVADGYCHLLMLRRKDFRDLLDGAAGGPRRDRGGGRPPHRRDRDRAGACSRAYQLTRLLGSPVPCRANRLPTAPFKRFGARGMSLDKDTVARIAPLARLKVADEELAPLAGELSGIFAWIEQLNEVDTRNVEPLSSVSDVTLPMRADKVTGRRHRRQGAGQAPGGAVLHRSGRQERRRLLHRAEGGCSGRGAYPHSLGEEPHHWRCSCLTQPGTRRRFHRSRSGKDELPRSDQTQQSNRWRFRSAVQRSITAARMDYPEGSMNYRPLPWISCRPRLQTEHRSRQ